MELLAPAGGMEQLRAAVAFGADAVYLAAERFGMRARAAHFRMDEIPAAVAFAHEHGVKVHVTCNILLHPDDIDGLPAFFRALDAAGVDAFIIGDLGAFAVAGEVSPRVERHVSTQASLADIARLRQETQPDLEIEAFAHGAMCMAVSGRCLISSYLTGRSGNKGHCTQPCRWSYQLEEEKRPGEFFPIEEDDRGTFIMNAKDLTMLAHLQALADAGVDSIKIEGRNKKAFYVATVVGAYRRALDGEPPEVVADELLAVSHRPYGTGFYFSEVEQATAYDGYEQETMHVADVVASSPRHPERSVQREVEGFPDDPQYLYLLCRNRFAEGDELETLVPHEPSRRLIVRDLHWLNTFGPDNHDEDAPATVKEALSRATATDWEPAAAANRSCNLYRILVGDASRYASDGSASAALSVSDKAVCDESAPFAIPEGSFLRKRTFRRSARHEDKERL